MKSIQSKARWLIVLALASIATAGSALTFKVNQVHMGNRGFTFAIWLPINNGGETIARFTESGTTPRVLHYSAECAVVGPAGSWLDIDIYLNGVVVPVTASNGDAFCGVGATAGFSGHRRQSISVAIQPRPGENTIQIVGRLNSGATEGIIGDTSLLVY